MKKMLGNQIFNADIKIPPSKSYSHRAIIASALANGSSKVINLGDSVDVNATLDAFKSLGIEIQREGNITSVVNDVQIRNEVRVNCKESGSTFRFLVPIIAALGLDATFLGEGKLPERPMKEFYDVLENHGVSLSYPEGKSLPLKMSGKLKSGIYQIPGNISSQYISGLLFSLPLIEGNSEIQLTTPLESVDYVNMTLDVLKEFAVSIEEKENGYFVKGKQEYQSVDYLVEGDFSNAAFFFVAGTLGCGSSKIFGLQNDTLQGDYEIVNIINKLGGQISFSEDFFSIRKRSLKGGIIDVTNIPDLLPILVVMSCFSLEQTTILGGERVRLKESDRIHAITKELNKMGAKIKETPDGVIVNPVKVLYGTSVDGWNDHRIVMALTVASMMAEGITTIEGAEAVNKSFPNFFDYTKNRE